MDAGTVEVQRIAQAVFNFALGARTFHVDEVYDDEAAQVAQSQLACDFVGRLEVGAQRSFLDVGTPRGTSGVDVDGDQCFGMVNHDSAARGQRNLATEGRFDLVLNLEAREKRHVIAVAFHARHISRHDVAHELLRLLVDVVGVDEDLADVGLEIVAYGANDQTAFLIDEERSLLAACSALYGAPQLHQVVEVPLKFFGTAADPGRTCDQTHALRHVELIHGFAQFVAIFALDATRYTATTGIVGHQDQIASSQRNECGECRALVAALILVDLDDEFLAFLEGFLDGRAVWFNAFTKIGARDFLEGEKAVPFCAVIDKGRFEAGLDAGDYGLVDVALALFLGGRFDVEVNEFLAIDDRDAEFFGLRRIEQHAFHCFVLPRANTGRQTASGSVGLY